MTDTITTLPFAPLADEYLDPLVRQAAQANMLKRRALGRIPSASVQNLDDILRRVGPAAGKASAASPAIIDLQNAPLPENDTSRPRGKKGADITDGMNKGPGVTNPAPYLTLPETLRNFDPAYRAAQWYGQGADPANPAYGDMPTDQTKGGYQTAEFAGDEPMNMAPTGGEPERNSEDGSVVPPPAVGLGNFSLYREPTSIAAFAPAAVPGAPDMAPRGTPAPAALRNMAPINPAVAASAAAQDDDVDFSGAARSAYDTASGNARDRFASILANKAKAGISDKDKWLSVALAGAHMAGSRSPNALGALGEGMAAGIQNYLVQDKLAKEIGARDADLALRGEQMAETAGDRAENRVTRAQDVKFRHQDRQDRNAARAEQLKYQYDALAQQAQNMQLTLEERRQAAQEALAVRREIAQMYTQGRENTANIAAKARIEAAKQRAQAAGAKGGHEINWINYAVEQGLVDDSQEGRLKALGMIRPDRSSDLTRTRANITATIYKQLLSDPRDTRTTQEKQEAAKAAAADFVRGGGAAPEAAPAAAAPAAPAGGQWSIKKVE